MNAVTRRRPTEAQCQDTIIAAARRCGWLVHAERPAVNRSGRWSTPVQGHPGFPDLVLITPDRTQLHLVELKRRPNKLEPAQHVWLDALEQVAAGTTSVHRHVWWVPEGLDEALRFITTTGRTS